MSITASGKKTVGTQISSRSSKLMGVLIQTNASNAATATVYDTVLSSVVLQDITYAAVATLGLAGNKLSIAYTAGATAGSEVVSVTGNAISIQIQTGVSTATQVKAAFDAAGSATALATATITGTAGTAQVTASVVRLTGGDGDGSILIQAVVPGANNFSLLSLGEEFGVASSGGLYLAISGTGASAIVYFQK